MAKLPTLSEGEIHASIVDYLNKAAPKGMVWHHSPNEGKRGWKAQSWLKKAGVRAGWPDLEIFYRGRVLFLEVKSKRGITSDAQDEVALLLPDAGFRAPIIVRSLEDAMAALAHFAHEARTEVA
jgi:hypothetical protein